MKKSYKKDTILKLLSSMSSEKEIRKYLDRFSSDDYRFAVKKVGGAVVRNKAKRRMRELVYSLKDRFKEFGYDYVLIARKNIVDKKFEDLKKDLNNTLKKMFPE